MQSSLISVLSRPFEDTAAAPCPHTDPSELGTPAEVFDRLPDPRRVRGRRYRRGELLGLRLVSVLGGARSLAQTARFAGGAAPEAHHRLGLSRAAPNASTPGRLLARLDAEVAAGALPAADRAHPRPWMRTRAGDPRRVTRA
ncbi:transposase family protein [Streptomyces flavofungini]|uniref:transposase family protein n=1 Tax=Streptomyces flavofungini TaxID=68200 RepID=UPI0025B092F7|nr:transposase family protein [Streptomyces flavofungini]WJV50989.1 transposase family protein [Streptomyces flavofungini]